MKKKLIALLAAATMVFAFVGCGTSQEEAAPETTAAAEETTAAPTEAATEAQADIGLDKAVEIALADAGLAESDVQFTKKNSDIDDGVSLYEVEFVSGETKYDYDIEASTGNIFNKDIESIYDD